MLVHITQWYTIDKLVKNNILKMLLFELQSKIQIAKKRRVYYLNEDFSNSELSQIHFTLSYNLRFWERNRFSRGFRSKDLHDRCSWLIANIRPENFCLSIHLLNELGLTSRGNEFYNLALVRTYTIYNAKTVP